MAGKKMKDMNKGVSHGIRKPPVKKKPEPRTPKTPKNAKRTSKETEPTADEMDAAMASNKTPNSQIKPKSASRAGKSGGKSQTRVISFQGKDSPVSSPVSSKVANSASGSETPEKPKKKFFGSKSSPRRVTVAITKNIVVEANTKRTKKISSESRKRVKSPINLRVLKPTKVHPLPVETKEAGSSPNEDLVAEIFGPDTPSPRRSPRVMPNSASYSVADRKRKLGFDVQSDQPSKKPRTDDKASSSNGEGSKVYPIFNKENWKKRAESKSPKAASPNKTRPRPRSKDDKLLQLQIDAGQKDLAATTCDTCLMVYVPGDDDDFHQHEMFHAKALKDLKLPKWKRENTVWSSYADETRIVCIDAEDPPYAWTKLLKIVEVIDEELGITSAEMKRKPGLKGFLFVRKDLVEGAVVAEPVSEGHRAIPPENERQPFCCAEESTPAACGINRIWTSCHRRRSGVASRLVDCVRRNFIPGQEIPKTRLAFSDPTPSGISFATKYCGLKDFLVYRPVA